MVKRKPAMPRASDWAALEADKGAITGHLLVRAARLVDEAALARVRAKGRWPDVRRAHLQLMPHIDPRGTRLSDIAARLGVTKQAAGQVVDELEQAGVVTRVPDPSDGRAKLVCFTRDGVRAMREGLAVLAEIDALVVGAVGEEKLGDLRAALATLITALERGDVAPGS
jgi:DNA-binding MarR family transcriptional regulator